MSCAYLGHGDSPSALFCDHLWQGPKMFASFSTLCFSLCVYVCLSLCVCRERSGHTAARTAVWGLWFFMADSSASNRDWQLLPSQVYELQTKISSTSNFVQGVNSISPLAQGLWPLWWLILFVSLARLWYPSISSNTSPDVALKVFLNVINI